MGKYKILNCGLKLRVLFDDQEIELRPLFESADPLFGIGVDSDQARNLAYALLLHIYGDKNFAEASEPSHHHRQLSQRIHRESRGRRGLYSPINLLNSTSTTVSQSATLNSRNPFPYVSHNRKEGL